MRRRIRLSIVLCVCVSICTAQEFPLFGKVSNEEIKLKECSFDKDAPAVVLIDEAVSNYNDERNLVTNRHVRIKILKDKGIDYANIVIPFYREDNFEFISLVEGMVINADNNGTASTTPLEKKSVFYKNVSDRLGEVRIAFPSVKAGSIIEYRYQSKMKHYGGLEDWYFQREIPVVHSKYILYIIPNYEFAYQVYKNDALEIKVDLDKKDGRALFEMKNVPGLEDEPFMDARRDYLQRVVFQLSGYGTGNFDKKNYMTTWDELIKERMASADFGGQLNKNLPGADDFIKRVKEKNSPFETMKFVYNYVRSNMEWNQINTRFSPEGIKNAWSKKKGTSADLNLILINLLKAAGLEVYPMLVSERYHGKVNTQYPFLDNFNTVYAAVIIDGKKYYLDATDKITPPQIIPYNILNTTALIVNKKAGGLVNIADESLMYKDMISVLATITPDDQIKGEVFVSSTDYARVKRLEHYFSNSSTYIDESFKKSRPSLRIDSFQIRNEDNDSLALEHKFNFSTSMEGTGDYKFIPINLFSGFEQNPFISNKRFSEINFGYRRNILVNTTLSLPQDYVIDALPKTIQVVNPDKTVVFTRELMKDDGSNKIVSRVKMDFRKSYYTADEYIDIKEFFRQMFDLLNEPIVIKKKS